MDENDVTELVRNGCLCVTEGSNMPLKQKAPDLIISSKILYSPGKTSNAGGVACSGLEMVQNSTKMKWTSEEVDRRLRQVMTDIQRHCMETAEEYGTLENYVNGANITGFKRVANAMIDQGAT